MNDNTDKEVKLPRGWNPCNKPVLWEYEPLKTVVSWKTIKQFSKSDYESLEYDEVPIKYDRIYWEIHGYEDSQEIELMFQIKEEKPNPHYNILLKKYQEAKEKYDKEMTEWRRFNEIWQEQQKIKEKQRNRKLYNKLKKEFESD